MAAKAPKAIADMQLTAVRTLTSVLPAPTLQSSVSGSTATLSWTPPAPTGQSVIAGYRLYKGVAANAVNTLVGTFTTLSATDTLPAAQFYRLEAFDQYQTGNTSSVVQCVPQTQTGGQTIKPFMGHWIYIDQGVSKDAQFTRTQQLVAAIPEVIGYQYLWKWKDLEHPTQPGNYSGDWAAPGQAGFSLVHRFADYLLSVGKKMHLNNFSYGGNGGDASKVGDIDPATGKPIPPLVDPRFFLSDQMPTYLSGSAYGPNTAAVDGIYGGLWMESFKQNWSKVRSFMRFWEPAVGARMLALSQAYGAEFDSHAGFGMWSHISESTLPTQMATYSVAADKAFHMGPNGAFAKMRQHWPTTPLRWWGNFIGTRQDMSDMINEAVKYKWLIAGPDLLNDYSDVIDAGSGTRNVDSDWVWKGKDTNNVVNPNYTNWVNQGAFGHDVEPLDLDNSHDDANNVHHLLHANKNGAMALFWYDLRYDLTRKNPDGTITIITPPRNRTDRPHPNLLDQIQSSARGGVPVNGITIPKLTNDSLYPPTWIVSATNVPQNLLMTLQGQSAAGSVGPFVNNIPQPTSPDFTQIAWNPVAGATGYKIYRNGTLLASPSGTGTAFSDSIATLSVNGTAGAGPQYFVANTYQYQVSSIVGGVESGKSATQSFIVYANGVQNGIGQDFSDTNLVTVDYNDTTLALAGQKCVKVTVTGASGYWLPVLGNSVCLWDMWGAAFPYLYMDVKITRVGQQLGILALRVGDVTIYSASGGPYSVLLNNYATLVNGQWVTVKIPKADYLTDRGPAGSGTPTVQNAMYKFLIQSPSGAVGEVWGFNNIRFGP